MNGSMKIFFLFIELLYLLVIMHFLRKKKLNLRYTLTWLFAAVVLVLITLIPQSITWLMHLVGIATPVNMVFVLEAIFVLLILLSLTVIVSHVTERIYKLTQTIAIMEKRIRELEFKAETPKEELEHITGRLPICKGSENEK